MLPSTCLKHFTDTFKTFWFIRSCPTAIQGYNFSVATQLSKLLHLWKIALATAIWEPWPPWAFSSIPSYTTKNTTYEYVCREGGGQESAITDDAAESSNNSLSDDIKGCIGFYSELLFSVSFHRHIIYCVKVFSSLRRMSLKLSFCECWEMLGDLTSVQRVFQTFKERETQFLEILLCYNLFGLSVLTSSLRPPTESI